jgi:nucleoside permease NupC
LELNPPSSIGCAENGQNFIQNQRDTTMKEIPCSIAISALVVAFVGITQCLNVNNSQVANAQSVVEH